MTRTAKMAAFSGIVSVITGFVSSLLETASLFVTLEHVPPFGMSLLLVTVGAIALRVSDDPHDD